MFFIGLKKGITLYRIIDGIIEISEVESIVHVPRYPRCIVKRLILTPIIGHWVIEDVFWTYNIKCFKSWTFKYGTLERILNDNDTIIHYFVGTDFRKVTNSSWKTPKT